MNRHIAITGGIGSGKSYVCKLLSERGIVVYDCDKAAKRLMAESAVLRKELCSLVGSDAYIGGVLNKRRMSEFILESDQHRLAVNNIVHPAVAADYLESGLEWVESAILFDSGFNKRVQFDAIVCVTAPEDVRIQRIIDRDHISYRQAAEWIANQMRQSEVVRLSDYVVVNDGVADIGKQIDKVLKHIYCENNIE